MNDSSLDQTLSRLSQRVAARRGGDVEKSYVARLLAKGEDAVLKKIGEEATELVMAAKDGVPERVVAECADLWFHSLIALAQHGLQAEDVLRELQRREGLSGLDEKALRQVRAREADEEARDEAGLVKLASTTVGGQTGNQPADETSPLQLLTHTLVNSWLYLSKAKIKMSDCIFCKIIHGEVPSRTVYQDDEVIVFHDIRAEAPLHLLIVPKRHIASLYEVTDADTGLLGKMLALAPRLAAEHGYLDGFRTRIHTGRAGGQEVFHLHFHVLAGTRTSSAA